jgi:outer membrane protein OmpA-like peptidoglycan-associated protein
MRHGRTISWISTTLLVSACASAPKPVAELDTARQAVAQVEGSPRAGVAATNIAEARKSLDKATTLANEGGHVDDVKYEATRAQRNAEIAAERIATANANDEIAKGNVERQEVVLEARNSEAQMQRERAQRMEQELRDLKAKQTDRGMILTLGDVLFDTGKSTLKPAAYQTIERLASVLNEDHTRKVLIEGHTDSAGSEDTNMALSLQRARSVQGALMQHGVSGSQISVAGRGESTPVASNENAGGRQQNRRVEMVFSQEPSRIASDSSL